jgi:hypothetical protein
MRKTCFLIAIAAVLSSLLAGCGNTANLTTTGPPSGGSVPVSLTMTDDPPAGVSVLFFQVSLTAASLQPAVGTGPSISLLNGNTPIQIDVTRLQALSAFLSTANVPEGTYGSLSLTFANPQLVIFNQSDTALGSSCAVGSICNLTPALDNSATVNFASTPFPVTISSNSPLGFLVDFHLNTVIQPDLSVNLGAANGITLAELPPVVPPVPPPFGFLTGTVGSIGTSSSGLSQFKLATPWGRTFNIDVNSSTVLADFPPCASPGILGCVATGDIVLVQVASVESNGELLAAKVILLSPNTTNQSVVEGTVVGFNAGQIKVILHNQFASPTAVPLGGMATVTLDKGAAFSVDTGGFTIPSGFVFSGFENLTFGQDLRLAVDPGTMFCAYSTVIAPGGWGPPTFCTFSTNNVQLEPSQLSGVITSIDSSASSFTLGKFPGIAFGPTPPVPALGITVDTTSQTIYQGFATNSFSGLADNDFVSVNGWLFETANGMLDPAMTPPVILAQTVKLHGSGLF